MRERVTNHFKRDFRYQINTMNNSCCIDDMSSSVNLPDDEENSDGHSQIICLIIQQVADNSVVPFRQIFRVRPREPLRAREEVVPWSERRQLHFSHYLLHRLLI